MNILTTLPFAKGGTGWVRGWAGWVRGGAMTEVTIDTTKDMNRVFTTNKKQ